MRIKIFRNKTLIASREVSNLSKSKFEAFRKLLANRFNSPQTKGAGVELSLALAFAGYGLFSNGNVDECDKAIKTLRRGHRQGRRAVVGLQGN